MRTTIEIPDALGARLQEFAGKDGVSGLVAEALESLFLEEPTRPGMDDIRKLSGSLSDDEAEHFRKVLRDLRAVR
jgi:ethanolamine ammonia-lyase large subunit